MARKPSRIYQIKVTLDDIRPPIWRRIVLPGNTSLLKLNDILQIVMGWEGYHLHMFTIDSLTYGDPADDAFGDLGTLDEARYKLSQVIDREGQRFHYEYDFGDSWRHTLLVERILPSEGAVRHPVCLKGKRACPPEDVGGPWGYEYFLEAIRDPLHEEHYTYLEWIGDEFDPEAFDLEAINNELRGIGRGRSTEASNDWYVEEDIFESLSIDPAPPWLLTLPDDQQTVVRNLALRQDVITLLTYLRDNKVTGTQSTGNLPLKAVREICTRFVQPPELESVIGDRVYPVRSEGEVWPLYFRHVLASAGGLIAGGPGRRWKITPRGDRYLTEPAPLQLWLLFVSWWYRINWAFASPFGFPGDYMPERFSWLVLERLLELQVGELTSFGSFADQIIDQAGLSWPTEDQEIGRSVLHRVVEHVVIDPLLGFGILQADYGRPMVFGRRFREIEEFKITPLGRRLLEEAANAVRWQ